MRQARLTRTCAELNKHDCAGALLFDPLNIRYVTDSTNMQVWVSHNPSRAVFVSADGYVVLWDFHGSEHLSSHLPLVREVRHGAGFFYMLAGDNEDQEAARFALEVEDLMREHCGGNRRLAVDKMEVSGIVALQRSGVEIFSGQRVMEQARLVKGVDEINAMRCAIATCESAMHAMREAMRPGMTEVELWAILHAENIVRGGEWIETRILSSGPRTNPWMQEAGPRRLREGDLVAFDTDLIGPYGMCADLSRTWYLGDGPPTGEQRQLFQVAHQHIQDNMELLRPGVNFHELTRLESRLPEKYRAQRYGVIMHGVGLCDEFPSIYYAEDALPGAFDYVLEPGMTLCVEAYVGEVGGRHGVKLEDQVLITESGCENLTAFPYDERLLG
jgi:Xaa-Pro aminopeptidase